MSPDRISSNPQPVLRRRRCAQPSVMIQSIFQSTLSPLKARTTFCVSKPVRRAACHVQWKPIRDPIYTIILCPHATFRGLSTQRDEDTRWGRPQKVQLTVVKTIISPFELHPRVRDMFQPVQQRWKKVQLFSDWRPRGFGKFGRVFC